MEILTLLYCITFPLQGKTNAVLMTHKYRGYIVVLSISKSVEPNEEQKEMTIGFGAPSRRCGNWSRPHALHRIRASGAAATS